jgi:hypothetical protein
MLDYDYNTIKRMQQAAQGNAMQLDPAQCIRTQFNVTQQPCPNYHHLIPSPPISITQICSIIVIYTHELSGGPFHKELTEMSEPHLWMFYGKRENATFVFCSTFTVHSLEALYVSILTFDKVTEFMNRLSWFAYTQIFGFQIVQQAWKLCELAKMAKKR